MRTISTELFAFLFFSTFTLIGKEMRFLQKRIIHFVTRRKTFQQYCIKILYRKPRLLDINSYSFDYTALKLLFSCCPCLIASGIFFLKPKPIVPAWSQHTPEWNMPPYKGNILCFASLTRSMEYIFALLTRSISQTLPCLFFVREQVSVDWCTMGPVNHLLSFHCCCLFSHSHHSAL